MITAQRSGIDGLFAALPEVDDEALARLHSRLIGRAADAGLLDVAYRTVDTPVGKLLLAATEKGLVRVAYDREGHDRVLATIAAELSPRILHAPRRLDQVSRQIDEYFAGARQGFDLTIDFRLARGFRRTVLGHLLRIAYGRTASYAAIAALAGSPRAVRAVGTACATNPLPVIVPCHRVVRSDGTLGQYVGGADAKRALIALEGAS
jgi:methylated-DNA-[protein]-cysteine S-methyltransferase